MRIRTSPTLAFPVICGLLIALVGILIPAHVAALDTNDKAEVETHRYDSDISKLRNLVVHSLYSHKDVFLRELLSNAQDALEKLRLTALKDDGMRMDGWQGNITIEARRSESGRGGQLIIRGKFQDEAKQTLGLTVLLAGRASLFHIT